MMLRTGLFYLALHTALSSLVRHRLGGPKEALIYASRKILPIPKAILLPLGLGNGIATKVDHDMVWSVESISRGESNIPVPVPIISPGFDPQGMFMNVGAMMPNNIVNQLIASVVKVPYIMNSVQEIKNTFETYGSLPPPDKIDIPITQ